MIKECDKRGISEILMTIMIIFGTIFAIIITYIIIQNVYFQGNQRFDVEKLNSSIELRDIGLNDTTKADFTNDLNQVTEEMIGIQVEVKNGTYSELFRIYSTLEELEKKRINLDLKKIKPENVKEVLMTPIFRISTGDEILGNFTYNVPKESIFLSKE